MVLCAKTPSLTRCRRARALGMANKSQQFRYKGNRCAACGLGVREIVDRYGTFNRLMEFHHINPIEKAANYENLVRRIISTEQLVELDKCVLLCSRCHDVIHAQNVSGKLELTVRVDGRDISQQFTGWYMLDHLDKKIVFISNQKILLEPYRVIVGDSPEQVLCGIEIERDSLLESWLVNLDVHKKLKIAAMDGHTLMTAEHVDGRRATLSQEMRFPFFTMELSAEKGEAPYLWVRNGMLLQRDGSIVTKGTLSCSLQLKEKMTNNQMRQT